MFKKKLIWGVGSIITAILPISTAISCSRFVDTGTDTLKVNDALKSEVGVQRLETLWMERILKGYDGTYDWKPFLNLPGGTQWEDHLKEAARYVIVNRLRNDKFYLINIANKIIKISKDLSANPEYDPKWLKDEGVLRQYPDLTEVFDNTILTDDALDFLLKENDTTGLKYETYKLLLSETYLKTVTKDEWADVNEDANENLSDMSLKINKEQFLIVKKAMENKFFAQWSITLDKNKSQGLLTKEFALLTDLQTAMKKGGLLGGLVSNSESKNVYIQELLSKKIMKTADWDYVNFEGFQSMTAIGSKKLSFTEDEWEKINAFDDWEGVIQEEDLIDKDIRAVLEKGETVDLKLVKGILPYYDTTESDYRLVADLSNADDQEKLDSIARLIALNDPSIFKEAKNYLLTKTDKKESQYLKVLNDEAKKILENKGADFLSEIKKD